MTGIEKTVERQRKFLRELSPGARSLLVGELERSVLRGESYGVTVNIVLAELERMVAELRNDLRSGQGIAVGSLLRTMHDSARGLRTELALPVDSTRGRALAAQRTQISDLLRTEIESMLGRVRRLLRPRPSRDPAKFGVGSK